MADGVSPPLRGHRSDVFPNAALVHFTTVMVPPLRLCHQVKIFESHDSEIEEDRVDEDDYDGSKDACCVIS